MFACPNCSGQILTRVRTDLGVLWKCDRCKGRAVALSVLRARVAKAYLNSLWQSARASEARPRLPSKDCPACHQPMVQVDTQGVGQAVELDVCRACHFIWFDPGEPEQLPIVPPAPPAKVELDPRAREAIALAKVDLIRRQAERESNLEGRDLPDEWWQVLLGAFGFPIEERAGALRRMPWITWVVALGMTVVTVWGLASGHLDGWIARFGLVPARLWESGGIALVTGFFLHGGLMHLAGNLYFLLIFGDNVEDYLGRFRFGVLLAAASVVGDMAHVFMEPGSQVPCVGASGGISGIIAYYALRFPDVRLAFCFRWAVVYFHWFRMSVRWALLIWFGLQLYGAWQQWAGFSNVSAAAHLGGAAAGVMFFLAERWAAPSARARSGSASGSI